MNVAMTLSVGWELAYYLHKNANLHFLSTYSLTLVSGNGTIMAFLVRNGPLIWMASTYWGSLFG